MEMEDYVAVTNIAIKKGNREVGGMDEAALKELAASIKEVGVLEPLILRLAKKGNKPYELVIGERRLRAAKLAKLKEVPVQVRELTDEEVVQVRVVENLHRQDVSPLDESASYRLLLESGVGNVIEVAAMVGKSEGHVRGRLKLHELCPDGEEALRAGTMTAGAAVKLARLPEKAQKKVLQHHFISGLVTAEEMQSWTLYGGVMVPLRHADFELTDAELVPKAGSCIECSKRAGSEPTLFEDQQVDQCLDSACFKRKREAVVTRIIGDQQVDVRLLGDEQFGIGIPTPKANQSYDWEKCRKKDEGAKCAMIITGKEAGKTLWMKKRQRANFSEADWQARRRKQDVERRANELVSLQLADVAVPGNDNLSVASESLGAVAWLLDNEPDFWRGLGMPEPPTKIDEAIEIVQGSGISMVLAALVYLAVAKAYRNRTFYRDEYLEKYVKDLVEFWKFDEGAALEGAMVQAEAEQVAIDEKLEKQRAAQEAQAADK